MTSRIEVRAVPRSGARVALLKAQEFVASAEAACSASRWDAAGLSAIHAGTSAADAAVIAAAGVRSASKDHGAVIELLGERVTEFSPTQRRQLAGLLKKKNAIAYEQRLAEKVEAQQMVDQAARLVLWAEGVVKQHTE